MSCFDQSEYRDQAPLFRRLTESFELCVYGLNLVKQDLEALRRLAKTPRGKERKEFLCGLRVLAALRETGAEFPQAQ